ncbi:hypothetical protein HY008_01540 [Candidatus Woesebacteria bacterium]|nr:hypothetical protein [Candidatus Woesebacteria bacterium]
MTKLLLTLAILVWPLGQLLQLTQFGQVIRLQVFDIIAGFLFLSLLFHQKKVVKDILFKPLAIFIVAASVSTTIAFFRGYAPGFVSLLYMLRFVAYTSFYFAFRIEGVKKYFPYLFLSTAVFLGFGFLQYIALPDVRFLKYIGFDDHYYRLIGTFLDPNFTGLVLAGLVILSPWPLLFVPLIGLALTFSRASFLSLAAGLIYLAIIKKQFKLLISLFLLGLILYLVPKPFGEGVNLFRSFSIISRFENQTEALKLFATSPLFGNSNFASRVDNSYLYVLATTGIIGFAAFLNFLKASWKITKNIAAKAALVAIFTHSLFNNSFFYSWILALFFLLLNVNPKERTSA